MAVAVRVINIIGTKDDPLLDTKRCHEKAIVFSHLKEWRAEILFAEISDKRIRFCCQNFDNCDDSKVIPD